MPNNTLHIDQLHQDPRNARKHNERNLDMIASSLTEVGAARSIVMDEDNIILAGNGTVQAAKKAGLKNVRVVEASGDEIIAVRRSGLTEEQKRKLALYDNRAAELAEWDAEVVKELSVEEDLSGLFSDKELKKILKNSDTSGLEEEIFDIPMDTDSEIASRFVQYNTNFVYPSGNRYGIPDLKPEMLSRLPNSIKTHSSRQTYKKGDTALLVWQNTSAKNMPSDSILSFYTHDWKFESLWDNLERYAQKIVDSRFTAIVSPNWTLFKDDPVAVRIWRTYKSRYIGRFFQELGIPIIPDIEFSFDQKYSDIELVLSGIPCGLPAIAFQQQAGYHPEELPMLVEILTEIEQKIKPEKMLVYGEKHKELFQSSSFFSKMVFVPTINSLLNQNKKAKI